MSRQGGRPAARQSGSSQTFIPPVKPIVPSTTTILRWVRKLMKRGPQREARRVEALRTRRRRRAAGGRNAAGAAARRVDEHADFDPGARALDQQVAEAASRSRRRPRCRTRGGRGVSRPAIVRSMAAKRRFAAIVVNEAVARRERRLVEPGGELHLAERRRAASRPRGSTSAKWHSPRGWRGRGSGALAARAAGGRSGSRPGGRRAAEGQVTIQARVAVGARRSVTNPDGDGADPDDLQRATIHPAHVRRLQQPGKTRAAFAGIELSAGLAH